MFFSKNKQTAPIQEDIEIPVFQETDQPPVCIIGNSPEALFLAARLQKNGENTCFISATEKSGSKEIILKEEYNLQKSKLKIKNRPLMPANPKLVIFAPRPHLLKSSLTDLRASQCEKTPVIVLNAIKDISMFANLFGKEFCFGYLQAGLAAEGSELTASGREPELCLSRTGFNEKQQKKLSELLKNLKLPLTFKKDENECFWNHFSVLALTLLFSLVYNRPLKSLIKDSDTKNILNEALTELTHLSGGNLSKAQKEDIRIQLSELPDSVGLSFKQDILNGRFNALNAVCEQIMDAAKKRKTQIPALSVLLRQCYNNFNQEILP